MKKPGILKELSVFMDDAIGGLIMRVEAEGIEGWGEASPFSIGTQRQTADEIATALDRIAPQLEPFHPLDRASVERAIASLPSAARAGIDMALHDWLGKRVKLPLWQLWGLDRADIVPTSVTIGISSPEAARDRVRSWFDRPEISGCLLKVKLGSPAGIAADRAMLQAVREVAPENTAIGVDANGGWSLAEAIDMCAWLADMGVTSVEQPLAVGQESVLPQLKGESPLPIVLDESCFVATDIPPLADCVAGINIKLMKSGGLTEAIRMVHAAKACGLRVMLGCYSNSAIANSAAAQLAPLADYVDLDSHLNLANDPFSGATLENGRLMPTIGPGFGVQNIPC
ncbi:MAG: enolase C-terminal domain-like protein [Cyanobacteriota bacterium]|nr:enolase C-terminal domain-like protein [Cyanobacteriota bacterium]